MKLLKDIVRVAASNIFNFGSSFLVGFVLPLYLSVSEYGLYKEFTLYLSFVYLFNLGYNDGITIKYGGKDPDLVNVKALKNEHTFITLFQLGILIAMLIVSLIMGNTQFVMVSIVSFFINMTTFHQNFMQATGEFKVYANANIIKTTVNVLTILFAIFFLNSSNAFPFILMNVVTNMVVYLALEYWFYNKYGGQWILGIRDNLLNFKVGLFILIANMSLTFVGNIGSWVVNLGFSIEDFAIYSFSNSLLNLILLIVNSVGLIFFNVIAREENQTKIKFMKRLLLLLGVIGAEVFFAFVVIVQLFLQDYVASLEILSVTFLTIPFIMVSKILVSNLYKARKNEKKYFRDMVLLVITSLIIVGTAYLLTKNMVVIAFATLLVYILWYAYSTEKEYRYLKSSRKEIFLLGSFIVVFYIMANFFPVYIGAVGYLIYIIGIVYLFRSDFLQLYQAVRK